MTVEPVPLIGRGRCGCTGDECSCSFISTDTVLVEGDGSASDPTSLDIVNPRLYLDVLDTATVNLTKTGSGTPVNPIHVSGTSTPAAVSVTTFTADGTYPVPATASMLRIRAIGGGGGGGGGQTAATGARGGGGGQGGAITEVLVPTSRIGASLDVTIGAAGVQGSGAASGGGTGTNGTSGGDTTVEDGSTIIAAGSGGQLGEAGGNGGDGGDIDQAGTVRGGRGASAVISGTNPNAANTCLAASGGGAGASYTTGNVTIIGSDGGNPLCLGTSGGAHGVAAVGANGGTSAGGGGGDHGFRGGHGGNYGGGGGGGGSRITGAGGAGNGGNGAPGLVEITAW